MFRCKIIIVLFDSGAQRNLKITYNDKLPHYRDFFTNAQISITTTEQIYNVLILNNFIHRKTVAVQYKQRAIQQQTAIHEKRQASQSSRLRITRVT